MCVTGCTHACALWIHLELRSQAHLSVRLFLPTCFTLVAGWLGVVRMHLCLDVTAPRACAGLRRGGLPGWAAETLPRPGLAGGQGSPPWGGALGARVSLAGLDQPSLTRPLAADERTCLSSWGRRASRGRSRPPPPAALCPPLAATAGRTGRPVASAASSAQAPAPAPLAGYVVLWALRQGRWLALTYDL